jgi:predicted nuclease with TOPRIM domain
MAERQQERAELVKWLRQRSAYLEHAENAARLLEEDGQEIERIQSAYETSYRLGGEWRDRAEKAEAELARITDILAELADLMDATVRGDYKPDSFTTQPARLALSPAHQGDQT